MGVAECRKRLPGEFVESPSLEMFRTRLDTIRSHVLDLTLL